MLPGKSSDLFELAERVAEQTSGRRPPPPVVPHRPPPAPAYAYETAGRQPPQLPRPTIPCSSTPDSEAELADKERDHVW